MGRGASWPDRTGVPVRKGRATGPHRGRPAGQDTAAEGQRRRSCFPSGVGGGLGPLLPPGLGGQASLPGRGPWVPAGPWRPEVLGVNLHVTRRPRCSASRSFIVPCGHVGWRPRARREALPPGSTEHRDRLHPVPSPVQPVLGWAGRHCGVESKVWAGTRFHTGWGRAVLQFAHFGGPSKNGPEDSFEAQGGHSCLCF